MLLTNNQQAFLEFVRAGLWADVGSMDLRNHDFLEHVDWEAIYQLAGEQSVVGLVTAGIERYKNLCVNLDLDWLCS